MPFDVKSVASLDPLNVPTMRNIVDILHSLVEEGIEAHTHMFTILTRHCDTQDFDTLYNVTGLSGSVETVTEFIRNLVTDDYK